MFKKKGFIYPDLGIDLPSKFVYDLKSIDKDLYVLYHPWKTLWEDIINFDIGSGEDQRLNIHWYGSQLVFGHVYTDIKKDPIPDNTWHVWRYCSNAPGWAHVIQIQSKTEDYLTSILMNLHTQAVFKDRYNDIAWNQVYQDNLFKAQKQKRTDHYNLFADVQQENKSAFKPAMENFSRNITAPTNQKVEKITSYKGQSRKTKIIRDATDAEGGLVFPDAWKKDD